MKKQLFAIFAPLLLTLTTMAVPAKKGVHKTLMTTDGTLVTATLVGDEHGHFWRGSDGQAYHLQDDRFVPVDGTTIVRRAQMRRTRTNARRAQQLPSRRAIKYEGNKRCAIILVNFSDKTFTKSHDQAYFYRMANEKNFTQYPFKGSVSDYFSDQSRGQFNLEFDVLGPVTLSKKQSYYGGNDEEGYDKHPSEMVCEAVKLVKDQVSDWSIYDWDGDRYVDQVYLIYAGKGEADSGEEDTIWPHAYNLWSAKQYDGDGDGPVAVGTDLWVDSYACGSELNGNGKICGIGTMCHEFSHCLGFPDFYDTDYSGAPGTDNWDLMCSGNYCGNGYQPVGYTSYELMEAGWLEPIKLESENVTVENMKSLQNGGQSYIIYNKAHRDEYFLLENRQYEGWDADIPGRGLLILHVDYDAGVWFDNSPNDDPNHQRMLVVPADGEYQREWVEEDDYGWYYFPEGIATDIFPQKNGKAFNRSFVTLDSLAKQGARFFNENIDGTHYVDFSVENIVQNKDKTVSFRFVADYKGDPYVDEDDLTAITAISVAPDKKNKRYFTLDGRFVGTDYTALPRGLYLSDGKKIYHK